MPVWEGGREGGRMGEREGGRMGRGSVAFSDVIQLKNLPTKCKARKVMETVRFSPKKCGDNTVDLHVRTKVPAGRK